MMRMILAGVAALTVSIAAPAAAEDPTAEDPTSGFTGWRQIQNVFQRECTDDKGFQITLTASHENRYQCKDDITLEVPCDHAAFNQIVSLALAAFLSGKEITAWVNGCDGEGDATVTALHVR